MFLISAVGLLSSTKKGKDNLTSKLCVNKGHLTS